MVHPAQPKYYYVLDGRDAITSVSPAWLGFARENGARELTAEAVLGHSLWNFIQGAETVRLYQAILRRVRSNSSRVVVPFRCDSPTLRRYMRLEISSQPLECVQFIGVLQRVEPCSRLNLLDPRFPRSDCVLSLCSFCKRALVEPYGWLEIEDAVARLHLLEEAQAPRLRQLVCPNCLAASGVQS